MYCQCQIQWKLSQILKNNIDVEVRIHEFIMVIEHISPANCIKLITPCKLCVYFAICTSIEKQLCSCRHNIKYVDNADELYSGIANGRLLTIWNFTHIKIIYFRFVLESYVVACYGELYTQRF